MSTLLIVAAAPVGEPALEAVRRRHRRDPDLAVVISVPRPRPRLGAVVYEEVVEQAARIRADLAWLLLAEREGIDATTEVGADDLHAAAVDAAAVHDPDDILLVAAGSAAFTRWRHRSETERLAELTGVRVERVGPGGHSPVHVAVALADEPEAAEPLLRSLAARDGDRRRLVVALVPLAHGTGPAARDAASRRDELVDRLRAGGAWAMGMVGDPDPLVAAANVLDALPADEVLIALSSDSRRHWPRTVLERRLRDAVRTPVTTVAPRGPLSAVA